MDNTKITNTASLKASTALQNNQLTTSSTSIPPSTNIPQKVKTEETNGSRRASTTTKENESIKMDISSSSPAAASLLTNLKKNQSILDIKMDAAKLHHQHIMLNMLRNTPITAKNFYKVINLIHPMSCMDSYPQFFFLEGTNVYIFPFLSISTNE